MTGLYSHPIFAPRKVIGKLPYVCTYIENNKNMGITLYGIDENDILDNYSCIYSKLRIDGILQAVIPELDSEILKMLVEYNEHKTN